MFPPLLAGGGLLPGTCTVCSYNYIIFYKQSVCLSVSQSVCGKFGPFTAIQSIMEAFSAPRWCELAEAEHMDLVFKEDAPLASQNMFRVIQVDRSFFLISVFSMVTTFSNEIETHVFSGLCSSCRDRETTEIIYERPWWWEKYVCLPTQLDLAVRLLQRLTDTGQSR